MWNLLNPGEHNTPGIVRKLQLKWGAGSASQLGSSLIDGENVSNSAIKVAGDVAGQREVFQAFDKTPRLPIKRKSAVLGLNGEVRVDLIFPDDLSVLHAMGKALIRNTPL